MGLSCVRWIGFLGLVALLSWTMPAAKPVLYLVGDSTVKNGQGDGSNGLWGWGSFIHAYLDTTRLDIENHALGGTSSRTFRTRGLWDSVLVKLKEGDMVMLQFGHNDSGPLDDTARARGTLSGIGDEAKEIYNPITQQQETVYTYGRYLAAFVQEAKTKEATVYICSPIPRNNWKGGTVATRTESYPQWAKQVAEQQDAYYIDLHERIVAKYNKMGSAKVQAYFTEADHTHTNETGARVNSETVADAIASLVQNPLKEYLKLN